MRFYRARGLLSAGPDARIHFCPRPPCTWTATVITLKIVPGIRKLKGRGAFKTRARAISQAGVAQLVEHLICNQRVGGSNPFASSIFTGRGIQRVGTPQAVGEGAHVRYLVALRAAVAVDCAGALSRGAKYTVDFAQVAEWLKAADCKSAALRATEVRILPCAP